MFSSLISALGNQSPVALLDQPVIYSGLVWFGLRAGTKPNQTNKHTEPDHHRSYLFLRVDFTEPGGLHHRTLRRLAAVVRLEVLRKVLV